MKSVSIVIPNFNGKELLRQNLAVLLENCRGLNSEYEVIVVDDGSNDGSADFLKGRFPEVKIIALAKNRGFSYACNTGLRHAKGEVVYLLNSDIKVCPGFLEPLLSHFEKGDVFAVSSIEVDAKDSRDNKSIKFGIPLVDFKFGLFWYRYHEIERKKESSFGSVEVFCVSGGHSAYHREKFLALGGFDNLFRPFYAEDGDICWQAWKRGWRNLLEPASKVIHERKGTIGRYYSPSEIKKIHWKNRLLMMWKNLDSPQLILEHLFFLLPEFLLCPLLGKSEFSHGVIGAFRQIREVVSSRRICRIRENIYSDSQLFRRFSLAPQTAPVNILYLHETARASGAENSLLNLVRHLNRNSFRPFFVLPENGPFAERLQKEDVRLYFISFPRFRRLIGVPPTVKKLVKIIKENNINLIHSNSIRTHLYATLAAKITAIPVIWHQRNLITDELVDPDRVLSFFADRIICNTYSIADRFRRNATLPKKVRVVHNGVDIQRFHPRISGKGIRAEFAISENETVIGMTSRFGPDKGHETFLQAAALLLQRCGNSALLKFMLAGDAVFEEDRWRQNYLRNLASHLCLDEKVVFCGYRENMPEAYAGMDIFVLASRAEPAGRVILEAMAMAKPIVATRSGGTPEMVIDGENGILVSPDNADALAGALLYLIKNRDLAEKMGERARRKVEDSFSIQRNVEETSKIYFELAR